MPVRLPIGKIIIYSDDFLHKGEGDGRAFKDLIIINTVVPFLYTYGLHKADERMCERAGRFLEELKAESNHIIRSWSDAGLPVVSAADSQALIQLQRVL